MEYIYCRWGTGGHEDEYVIHLTDDKIPRYGYVELATVLMNELPTTYLIANRGTRIEVIGPRNDDLLLDTLSELGYRVDFGHA